MRLSIGWEASPWGLPSAQGAIVAREAWRTLDDAGHGFSGVWAPVQRQAYRRRSEAVAFGRCKESLIIFLALGRQLRTVLASRLERESTSSLRLLLFLLFLASNLFEKLTAFGSLRMTLDKSFS